MTRKAKSPKAGKAQAKDPRVKARALADAQLTTDEAAAAKHGISERTLRRWRTELETDPKLAAAWRKLQQRFEDAFVIDAVKTFGALSKRLQELAPTIDDPRDLVVGLEKVGDILVQARALPRVGDEDDGEPSLDREGAAYPEDPEAADTGAIH